jgi:hypothetical protein
VINGLRFLVNDQSESQRTPEDSFLLKRFSLDRQMSHPTCAGFTATNKR